MKLTLVPYAGLCNRMNAIMSALALQNKTNIKTSIFWEKTKDCCAWYDELFEPIPSLQINRLQHYYLKPSSKKNLFLPSLLRLFLFDKTYKGIAISNKTLLMDGEDLGNVYVSSFNRFCPLCETEKLGRFFIPLPHIKKLIDDIICQYGIRTVGIHIRRTDNVAAIKNSPVELFYKEMDEEIRENPDVTFFLATDNDCLKTEIKNRYGARIITYNSSLNRYSLEGMIDAVVELWCLATCKKIIGSSNSTYSSVASKLFGNPIYIVAN